MKLVNTCVLLLFLSFGASAQDFDARLLEKFKQSELQDLKTNAPDKLRLMTYALDHGMYIAESGNTKGASLPEIAAPQEGQTYLDLGLEISDVNQYFQIAGENRILVVKSFWVLNNELETK